MSLQGSKQYKLSKPYSPGRPSQTQGKEVFQARQAKENKYYFNNTYLKKNASNSTKKDNYSLHSRAGFSKSKNSKLEGRNKKRGSHGADRTRTEDQEGLKGHVKGLYARQFLLLNKGGNSKTFLKDGQKNSLNLCKRRKRSSLQNKHAIRIHTEKPINDLAFSSKYIHLNGHLKEKVNSKKKKSHIFHETENSFLARIWPEQNQLNKGSIYETMAKHNRNSKKGKTGSQLQEIKRESKSKNNQDRKKNMVVDISSEMPKMFLQSTRFKKSGLGYSGQTGSPGQNIKVRNPKELRNLKGGNKKSPSNAVFKYSLNGFINSNRFIKNYRPKHRDSTKKQMDLLNRIATGKKRDTKRSKSNENPRKARPIVSPWTIYSKTPTTCTLLSRRSALPRRPPTLPKS